MAKVGQQLFRVLFEHHLLVLQIVYGGDTGVDVSNDDERRVLKDGSQGDHWPAAAALKEQGAGGDAVVGASGHDFVDDVGFGVGFDEADIQIVVAVIALFQRRVVAGKLELVPPFELECHAFRRRGQRDSRAERQKKGEREAHGPAGVGHCLMRYCHALAI